MAMASRSKKTSSKPIADTGLYRRLNAGHIIRMYQLAIDNIPGKELLSGVAQLAGVVAGIVERLPRLVAPHDSGGR